MSSKPARRNIRAYYLSFIAVNHASSECWLSGSGGGRGFPGLLSVSGIGSSLLSLVNRRRRCPTAVIPMLLTIHYLLDGSSSFVGR